MRWYILAVIVLATISAVILMTLWQDCSSHGFAECPGNCAVCPPCEVCSSLVCDTKQACENRGFNESWRAGIGQH